MRRPVAVPAALLGVDSSGNARPQATINVGELTAGLSYTFRLYVKDSIGFSGYATVDLEVNTAPSSGSMSVTPPKGYPFTTEFAFAALNWVDTSLEDYPLSYLFTYVVSGSGSAESPAANSQDSATLLEVLLPVGLQSSNYSVTTSVYVVDSFGAMSAAASDTARVKPLKQSIEKLSNTSKVAVNAYLDSGDPEKTLNALSATASNIVSSRSLTSRRRLQSSVSTEEKVTAH